MRFRCGQIGVFEILNGYDNIDNKYFLSGTKGRTTLMGAGAT